MALPPLLAGPHVSVEHRPALRFTVSLQEEEATVVSLKKLVRDSQRCNQNEAATPPDALGGGSQNPGAMPAMPLPPPHPNTARDLADGLPPSANRFSSVIEKIERYYTGHESEEEEDSPASEERVRKEALLRQRHRDEDFYDTDDSFIDDDDLDAYFSDQGEPEHQGFVVTKGAFKPRPPRPEGDSAKSAKPKKKRPRLQMTECKLGHDRKQPAKKGEGGKGSQASKGKGRERVNLESPSKKAKVLGDKPGMGVREAEQRMPEGASHGSGRAEEIAALVLPVLAGAPPSYVPGEQGSGKAVVRGDESKGPDVVVGVVAAKKAGKKQLLSDKVQRALQVSKEREDAAAAAKREADARRAAKKKGEKQKAKKVGGEGETSMRAEGTDVQGSLLSATVSGVPIGLLNAEVSNARTHGSRPESKKRARAEEDHGDTTQDTVGAAKAVKVEASEGATEEGHAGKARKARATDSERLDAAIAELSASVAELCPPALGGETEEGRGGADEGDDAAKKKRLPQPTQAALSKVAKVAGMRKGQIPPELYPRLSPIVGHVLKDASLKMNLKRALAKAIEAKKGGAVTPKKEPAKKATGGTPRRKEEGVKKKGEAMGEQNTGGTDASPSEYARTSEAAANEQNGGRQPSDVASMQRLSVAREVLEAHIQQRMQAGEGAIPGSSASPGGCEGAFQWDHAMENALLAVVRAAKEGAGEQNGQVVKTLYRDLTQLWPPDVVGVSDLQKAIRRAKSRVENKLASGPGRAGAGGSAKRRKDADGTKALNKKGGDEAAEGSPRDNGGRSETNVEVEGEVQEQVVGEEPGAPGASVSIEATQLLPGIFKHLQTRPPQTVL